jgi:hypothetical protein
MMRLLVSITCRSSQRADSKGALMMIRILFVAVVLITVASTILFFAQGGFGGGHGRFDGVIFLLALPWALIHWPEFLTKSDFVWLIALPFILNVLVLLLFARVRRSLRADSLPRAEPNHK